jgi:flagellar hook-basal body complex protein FliE
MSLIGSISQLQSPLLNRLAGNPRVEGPREALTPRVGDAAAPGVAAAPSFTQVLEQVVSAVDAKQTQAQEVTRKVLLGENDQLHQSVIAMQEAGVAFQLMVEVRNKLVESYQELMRMPV